MNLRDQVAELQRLDRDRAVKLDSLVIRALTDAPSALNPQEIVVLLAGVDGMTVDVAYRTLQRLKGERRVDSPSDGKYTARRPGVLQQQLRESPAEKTEEAAASSGDAYRSDEPLTPRQNGPRTTSSSTRRTPHTVRSPR